MKTKLPLLLLGIILGGTGALLWPRFVTPYLPAGLAPSTEATFFAGVIRLSVPSSSSLPHRPQ